MSVHVVSDLHGAADALAGAVPEGSTLLLLGDLLNVIDYMDMSGILVEIFSVDAVRHVVDLRAQGRFEEARSVMRGRAEGREQEIRARFGELAAAQYEQVFAALPQPTYLILGNVDVPQLAEAFVAGCPRAESVDARVIELEGESFGFVGGALPTPLQVAGEVPPEKLRAGLEAIGQVDVLCTHIPPAIPELCFDTLAGREEQGSEDILRFIEDVQPAVHYFGHVHQPLVSSLRVGRTLCVNAGHFRSTRSAISHAALRSAISQ